MDRRFLGILAVIAVVLVGVFVFSSRSNPTPASSSQPTNHVEGQGKAGVTLIEYGDYQCPYCGGYYPIIKQVVSQFSSQIYFQFRNLPLTSLHPNAFAGARAAEAAGLQNKYWQMHDLLYQENQDYYDNGTNTWVNASNPMNDFDSYAQQLGLNVTKFDNDYASTQVGDVINADIAAFNKTGLSESTPTFFLDGKNISDQSLAVGTSGNPYVYNQAASVSNFDKIIQAEINAKTRQ